MSKELLAATVKELRDWPDVTMTEEQQGKHRKVTLSYKNQNRLVVFANTPSDQRALPNHLALVRRELRGLGAIKSHPQAVKIERLFRPYVPATQTSFANLEITPMKPNNKIEAIFTLVNDLRYGEMLTLAGILRDAATDIGLRRSFESDWAKMLHSIAATKPAEQAEV